MDELRYHYKYPHPSVTTDAVVFGFDGRLLHLLLVERGAEPFKGAWALPGGFMRMDETAEECVRRELREETGVSQVYLEQLHTFSGVDRDPRERVVTVAFLALVRKADYRLLAGDDAAQACWFPAEELPPLAFDHEEIIQTGRERLRELIQTRPLAFKLLDALFSIAELQRLYEAINDTAYDRRNFHKKMISSGLLHEAELPPAPEGTFFVASDSGPTLAHVAAEADMPPMADAGNSELGTDEVFGIGATPSEAGPPASRGRQGTLYSFDEEAYERKQQRRPSRKNPLAP